MLIPGKCPRKTHFNTQWGEALTLPIVLQLQNQNHVLQMTFCYNCSPGPPKLLDLLSALILVRKVVLSDLPRPPIADFKYPQLLDLKIRHLKRQIQFIFRPRKGTMLIHPIRIAPHGYVEHSQCKISHIQILELRNV